jgi:predicted MFS family arabinose efflux permease
MSTAAEAQTRPRHYEAGLVVLLMLFWGCVGLNRVGIGAIIPQLLHEFGMQKWQASMLIAGTSVTWAFSSWIGGWLSDRYGRRRVLLPAAFFVAVMTASMGLAVGFWSMFVVRDLLGIADGVGWSVGESIVSEESPPERRGINQAIFAGGYTLIGAGLGSIIITHITAALGWQWAFPIVSAFMLPVVLAMVLFLREPRQHSERHTIDWRAAFRLLRDPSMARITVLGCAALTWLAVSIALNHLYLEEVRGFSAPMAGNIMSAWGFAGAAGSIVIPFLSDFIGRRLAVSLAALATVAAMALYLGGGFNAGLLALLVGIAGFFGFGLLPVVIATCVSELVPERLRGSALGVTNFFAVIVGTTIMPLFAGAIADWVGVATAAWIPAAAMLLIAFMIFSVRETAPRLLARNGGLAAAQGN